MTKPLSRSHAARRAAAAAVGLWTLVAGPSCSREGVGDGPRVFRWVDHAGESTVETTVDLRDAERRRAATDERVERHDLDEWGSFRRRAGSTVARALACALGEPGAAGVGLEEGPEGSRVAVLRGPAALWRPLSTAGGTVEVRVAAAAEPDAVWRAVVVRVPDELDVDTDSPEWISRLTRRDELVEHRLLEDGREGGAAGTYSFSFRGVLGQRWLAAVLVERGTVRVHGVELATLGPFGVALHRAGEELGSPHARRVEVGGDHREAVVLAAPGRISIPLRIPAGGARLTFAAARARRDAPDVRADVRVSSADRRVERSVRLARRDGDAPHLWTEAALELDVFAGEDVRLELAARPVDDAGPVLVAFANPTVVGRRPPPAARHDVVLVSLDTVRADRLSLYGHPRPTSPELVEIGAGAAVFEAAIAPSPWTLPSHVTLLSGLHPERHRVDVRTRRVDEARVPLLAAELRAAGYRTVALTGGGYVDPEFGFAAGFEEYRVDDPGVADRTGDPVLRARRERSRARIDALLRGPRDRPLFLFVHSYVAHEYEASDEELAAVGAAPIPSAERRRVDRVTLRRRISETGIEVHLEELAELSVRYDATLRAADRLAGDVERSLRAGGRADRTILVVTSDHGEELGDHGSFGHKHALHEELIRVPLVLRVPGLTPARVGDVVALEDVAPTVRDVLGLPAADADGRSLLPLLRGEALEPIPALSTLRFRWGEDAGIAALRGRRWKVRETRRPGALAQVALFDLEAAGEDEDVAARHRNRLLVLRHVLDRRREALQSAAAGAAPADLTPARVAELRALGYVGEDE